MNNMPDAARIADTPNYLPVPFKKFVKRLDGIGIDLISKMLQYDPAKRISAEQAMRHRMYYNILYIYIYI